MAIWSRTIAELKRHIGVTVRSVRNRAEITAEEWLSINAAINEAAIDICIERGLDTPKIILSSDTETLTAGTAYVDLDSDILAILDGTVKIESESIILTRFTGDLAAFYAYDPGETTSNGVPQNYAIDTDGSGNMRLQFRPIPDSAYTVAFRCERLPAEDTVSSIPGWWHGALRSLATAISLEALGLPIGTHQSRYEDRMKNIRDKNRGDDSARYVQIDLGYSTPVPPELRINGSI